MHVDCNCNWEKQKKKISSVHYRVCLMSYMPVLCLLCLSMFTACVYLCHVCSISWVYTFVWTCILLWMYLHTWSVINMPNLYILSVCILWVIMCLLYIWCASSMIISWKLYNSCLSRFFIRECPLNALNMLRNVIYVSFNVLSCIVCYWLHYWCDCSLQYLMCIPCDCFMYDNLLHVWHVFNMNDYMCTYCMPLIAT